MQLNFQEDYPETCAVETKRESTNTSKQIKGWQGGHPLVDVLFDDDLDLPAKLPSIKRHEKGWGVTPMEDL